MDQDPRRLRGAGQRTNGIAIRKSPRGWRIMLTRPVMRYLQVSPSVASLLRQQIQPVTFGLRQCDPFATLRTRRPFRRLPRDPGLGVASLRSCLCRHALSEDRCLQQTGTPLFAKPIAVAADRDDVAVSRRSAGGMRKGLALASMPPGLPTGHPLQFGIF